MNVSRRARSVPQPRGGYAPISEFNLVSLTDEEELFPEENIHSSLVGLVVDNLTRLNAGVDRKDVFSIAVRGAKVAEKAGYTGSFEKAVYYIMKITGSDDSSIINACKLATYEVWSRSAYHGDGWKKPEEINPDKQTIHNIQIMLKRTAWWLDMFKPLVKTGFTFQPAENATKEHFMKMMVSREGSFGGYTPTVSSGDGDYLTEGKMWDMKVSKNKPTSKDTLQILMYWIMGQHSGQEIYNGISSIGIFNPRRFEIYALPTEDIDSAIIQAVEKDVICY